MQEDLDAIDKLIVDVEATYSKSGHPDPDIGKHVTKPLILTILYFFMEPNIIGLAKFWFFYGHNLFDIVFAQYLHL